MAAPDVIDSHREKHSLLTHRLEHFTEEHRCLSFETYAGHPGESEDRE
jgi:hypothetical protein